MEQLQAWWRARTERERRLLQGAALLVFAVLLPIWAYFSVYTFRADAAARLASARQIEFQVQQIAVASRGNAGGAQAQDASLRARTLAAAQTAGLRATQVQEGVGSVRIAFEPADSLAVYRWIDLVGRTGLFVSRSTIVRVAQSDLVGSEFEVTESP